MLDMQSLPSLEKFDSQLLDLFKPSAVEQAVAGALDDMSAGGDPDAALQRLMSMKHLNSYKNTNMYGSHALHPAAAGGAHHHMGGSVPVGPSALDQAAQAMLAQTDAFLRGEEDPDCETPAAAARESRRRNRGNRLGEFIKAEEEAGEVTGSAAARGDGGPADSHDSTQSPSKRGRTTTTATGADSDGGKSLAVTADMDDATKTRIRREKNRVAARKCRAKKMQFMVDLQKTLRELMRKNEEYRLQVITWHKMFSREVRLREAMKRIISVMWQAGTNPAATGYTANDIIIGLESGTLDVNSLLRSLVAAGNSMSGGGGGGHYMSSLGGGSFGNLSLPGGQGLGGGLSERDLLAMQLSNTSDVTGLAGGSSSGASFGLGGGEGHAVTPVMADLGAGGGGGGEGGWLWSDSVGLVGGGPPGGITCITTGASLDG